MGWWYVLRTHGNAPSRQRAVGAAPAPAVSKAGTGPVFSLGVAGGSPDSGQWLLDLPGAVPG